MPALTTAEVSLDISPLRLPRRSPIRTVPIPRGRQKTPGAYAEVGHLTERVH